LKHLIFFALLFFSCNLIAQDNDDSTIIWQQNHYQNIPAPHFALVDVNGNFWNSDSLRGKVVVLNFWSIYCPGCFHELPELNLIPAEFSEDSVVFISVLFEKGPKADSVIAKHNFNYHLVTNGLQVQSDFYNNCFPSHIIIDRSGIIRYNVCGVVNRKMLLPEIRKALRS
jgi:peroxiredoxin